MKVHAPTLDVMGRSAATDSTAWGRAYAGVFDSRRALWVMTALFVVTGLVLVFGQFSVDDEGLQTHVFARWLVLEPIPMLFFQHIKPVVCLLLAIPSLGGVQAMRTVQVLLAASVAPMLAAVARTLGIRVPSLAALIVLASPLFLFGAANGVSNVNGVFATTVFLYLAISARRHWLAGLVLGCIPWVRPELAPFSILLWLHMTCIERNRGVALGATIFPVVYTLCGAVYHHDPLWLVHFAPALKFPIPDNPIWKSQHVDLRNILARLLLVTPAVGFVVTVQPRRLSSIERTLYLYMWIALLLQSSVPFLRLGNFGYSPRFFLQPLPMFALLSARAVEPWLEETRSRWTLCVLPVALAGIWAVSNGPPAAVTVSILGGYSAAAVLALLGRGKGVVGAVALTACLGLPLPRGEQATPVYFRPALAWLRDHAQDIRGATIYTNSAVMAFGIAHTANLTGTEVRFIGPPDILREFTALSNPDNGQRAAIWRAARQELFGKTIFWNELSPDSIPPNSVFLLRLDPRLSSMMTEAVWGSRLEVIATEKNLTVARLVPAGAVLTHPVPLRELSEGEPEGLLDP
jgi:hypothetical protein